MSEESAALFAMSPASLNGIRWAPEHNMCADVVSMISELRDHFARSALECGAGRTALGASARVSYSGRKAVRGRTALQSCRETKDAISRQVATKWARVAIDY